MGDPTVKPEDILKKLSRRNMLRKTAITATGAALLPAFLTGCNKDVWDMFSGHGGLGAVALTPEELKNAADNLNRMRALLNDLYNVAFKYDEVVLEALASTHDNPSWTHFIVDIIIDIAAAMASAVAIDAGGSLAVPAIACLSAFLHDWGIGINKPPELDVLNGFFATYQAGQLAMQDALDAHLGALTDETNNYANLQAAWQNPIVFNGGTYTLADLAKSFFPDKENHSVEYRKIYDPMYLHHKKSVWNLAIMKCCTYYENYHQAVVLEYEAANEFTGWVQGSWYPTNPGVYVRGDVTEVRNQSTLFTFVYWNLGIDGYPFPPAASSILFIDDTPGHVINPDGLFNRSCVFEQFSVTKPDFKGWHELAKIPNANFAPENDDFTFTGGLFPELTQK